MHGVSGPRSGEHPSTQGMSGPRSGEHPSMHGVSGPRSGEHPSMHGVSGPRSGEHPSDTRCLDAPSGELGLRSGEVRIRYGPSQAAESESNNHCACSAVGSPACSARANSGWSSISRRRAMRRNASRSCNAGERGAIESLLQPALQGQAQRRVPSFLEGDARHRALYSQISSCAGLKRRDERPVELAHAPLSDILQGDGFERALGRRRNSSEQRTSAKATRQGARSTRVPLLVTRRAAERSQQAARRTEGTQLRPQAAKRCDRCPFELCGPRKVCAESRAGILTLHEAVRPATRKTGRRAPDPDSGFGLARVTTRARERRPRKWLSIRLKSGLLEHTSGGSRRCAAESNPRHSAE